MLLQIAKLHPLFGGDVTNVDLSKPIEQHGIDEIQAALDRYAVLIFHGPKLTEEAQIAFAERFGPLEGQNGVLATNAARVSRKLVDISNLDEKNDVLRAQDRRRMFALGNQLWHTDSSFKKTPAKYSLLHAHSVTPEGGETQFVDTRAAYDALPEKMKARIDALQAEHSIFVSRGKLGFTEFSDEERRANPPVHRSLVRVHPGSGRKALYLASHASHIVGQPVPDGRMLIHELMEHATQPQFVYTHKWAPGDLVIWDNRCTLHRGRPYDEVNHRRDMRRATVSDLDPAVQDQRAAQGFARKFGMAVATFDYIIVGAGSAGCVLANRLSGNSRTSVLLVEAGGSDRHPYIAAPAGFLKTFADPRFNWCFTTEPGAAIGNRTIHFPRGKVLGGSSAINGHLYVRGQARDYDTWAQLGNRGWSYEEVLPYFRKSEDRSTDSDRFHGRDGPQHVSDIHERHPICEAFIAGAREIGIPRNDDYNGEV